MRVTFDTNTWQRVVVPERFRENPPAANAIHRAIKDGQIKGFLCETVVTLEAIPRGHRSSYLADSQEDAISINLHSDSAGKIEGRISFGGNTAAHPGMRPVLSDRLKRAFDLGFLYIPTSRLGTVRPTDFSAFASYRIPLTPEQNSNIWPLLEKIAEAANRLEERGYGQSALRRIAQTIQIRLGLSNEPWYEGLDSPLNATEQRAVDDAFAEWADGETVALHIGYGLDAICTEDKAGGRDRSIFSVSGRKWLNECYGVEICNLQQLADRVERSS